jgi:hypothetical protein
MRLNCDLDVKISEAIREKKPAPLQRDKSSEQIIELLTSQIRNNQNVLSAMEKEENRFRGKEGVLEEDNYGLNIEKEREKVRHAIHKERKDILLSKNTTDKLSDKLQN